MPFLGKSPTAGFASIVKDDLTPNGSTTAFTLSKQVANANDIAVFLGNVRQEPTDAYTVSGTTLTMSEAPASGLNFYVLHIAGTIESSVIPADGTITSAKLTSNLSLSGDLTVDTTSLKVDSTNNRVGIGTASPQYALQVNGGTDIMQLKGTGANSFIRFTDDNASSDFSIGADDGSSSGSGSFIIYDRTNSAYRLHINSSGETIPTLLKPDKYASLLGPETVTGGFVNGASTSTWHSITNLDINNYAGGYGAGNVGIQGEIHWTHGIVAKGYNTTIRFTLPPNSSNTHSSYSAGNFGSFNFSSNVYNTLPVIATHHTSMTSNHDIRLRLRNSTGNAYDPLRLEIYADTAPNASGAKITIWRG